MSFDFFRNINSTLYMSSDRMTISNNFLIFAIKDNAIKHSQEIIDNNYTQ